MLMLRRERELLDWETPGQGGASQVGVTVPHRGHLGIQGDVFVYHTVGGGRR